CFRLCSLLWPAAVRVLDVRRCQMQRTDHRLAGVGSHLRQGVLQSLSSRSEGAERIADPDAPVRAGDKFAGHTGTVSRQAGLMQPEGKFDEVGDAVRSHAFAAFILEGLNVAARCEKSL